MKKTCMNCSHYHGCLSEETFGYHIHDYCDAWDKTNTGPMHSLINEFLNFLPCSISADELKEAGLDDCGICDDNETGESYCYRFEEAPEKYDDEFFNRHFNHNKKLAIYILRKLLRENKQLIDSFDPAKDDFIYKEVELDDDDRKEYQELLDKIENYEA